MDLHIVSLLKLNIYELIPLSLESNYVLICRHLMKETKKNKDYIACLDPEAITISVIQLHPDYVTDHVARATQ